MRKKISLLISIVMLAALAIGGSTYALFTDNATNSNNTFVAGSVDIDSNRAVDTIPGPMFYTTAQEGQTHTNPPYNGIKPTGEWAPGDVHVRGLAVYNKGSLDVVLDKISAEVTNGGEISGALNVKVYKVLPLFLPNGTPMVTVPGDDSLDKDAMDSAIEEFNRFVSLDDPKNIFQWERIAAKAYRDLGNAMLEAGAQVQCNEIYKGTLADLISNPKILENKIYLKASPNPLVDRGTLLAFVVEMDKKTSNDYQGATGEFKFVVNATQARNNE